MGSAVKSIFGGGGSSRTTQTTRPELDPKAREMLEYLFPIIKGRVEEDPYSADYIQKLINQGKEGIESSTAEAQRQLTIRQAMQGVKGPYATYQAANIDKSRMGNIAAMMRDIALAAPEEKARRIQEALSFVYGIPVGQTTTYRGAKPNVGPEIAGGATDIFLQLLPLLIGMI